MITPKPLKKGSTVALLGVSGPIKSNADSGIAAVKAMGLVPKVYPSYTAKYGFLAGRDHERAGDLNDAFADPQVEGILCSRGGYGAARILDLLDWDMIAKNPKPLFGYSDVTAVIAALNQRAGFVAYHTPMPTTEWHNGLDDYTQSWLEAMLFGQEPGPYVNPVGAPAMETVVGGTACGPMCGGNLSLLAASMGTRWEIDTTGKILFIEEIEEAMYKIDGMLTQLRNGGKLDACAGIVIGAFSKCPPTPLEDPSRDLPFDQVISDLIAPAGKPTVKGFACGHCMPTASLPMGKVFALDADRCELREV